MGRRVVGSVSACFVAVAMAAATPVAAEDFYRGKTINIAVGNSAGGGHDAYARLLARHIARHIPGAPTIIVQNMPGAASARAVQYLDAAAPKDGTVMAAFSPDIITQSLLEPDKVKMDFSKLAWIGSMTRDYRACYAWHGTGVKTWDDLAKRGQFTVGSGAVGSSSYINGAILIRVFGVKIKQVLGYPGSAEIRLAIERGELDGACGSWSSVPANWVADGKIHPLVRFSAQELPGMAGVPYVADLARTPSDQRVLTLLLAAGETARPYVMSLAVPAERVAILRRAFDATMADAAFVDDAANVKLPLAPMSGADAARLIAGIYASSSAEVESAREAIR